MAAGMSSRMKASSSDQIEDKKINQANTRSKGLIEIGEDSKPLLYYLLLNAQQAGYKTIYLITGKDSSPFRLSIKNFSSLDHLQINYVTQHTPSTRIKPWGTADAVYQALEQFPNLKKEYFSVCNSDNFYSINAFRKIKEVEGGGGMIAYDLNFLKFNKKKIAGFALLVFDSNFRLQKIIEKPNLNDFKKQINSEGCLYISMNLYSFNGGHFYSFLKDCPVNPIRNEKELPTAILNMVLAKPGSVVGIPLQEHVPDLTVKGDIEYFENHLKDLNFLH
tara:strand:- start:55037 stop:55867 length:831 start_codon:yes stop_codon:yes gene_type:complete